MADRDMHWIVEPHKDHEFDYAPMPARNIDDDYDALDYAILRLEEQWDQIAPGDTITVSMRLVDAPMPEVEDDG